MKKIITVILIAFSLSTQAQKKDSVNVDTLHFISANDVYRILSQYSEKITFKDGQTFSQMFNAIYAELLKERESKK